jgi:ribonuclease HI
MEYSTIENSVEIAASSDALVAQRLNTSSYNFFTDSQIMENYYNSSDLSNPPHWSIKSMAATFLLAMKDADFKVHKIPRTMNSTAHSLAH